MNSLVSDGRNQNSQERLNIAPVLVSDDRNQHTRFPMLPLSHYGVLGKALGAGTYGGVYLINAPTGNVNDKAMKIFRPLALPEEGLASDILREVSILRRVQHPNIVKLIDILDFDPNRKGYTIRILLELADTSLANWITNKFNHANQSLIKSYMYQLTRALVYLHDNGIVHRDLKPPNILIFKDGRIVIADFGISRAGFILGGTYTMEVETLWWRAPELLLGARGYGPEIDIYALGIIFAELWKGEYIFRGYDNASDVLLKETSLLGHMTEEDWPGISGFKGYTPEIAELAKNRLGGKWEQELYTVLESHVPGMGIDLNGRQFPLRPELTLSKLGLNMIKKATYPNPSKRLSARQLLDDPYFLELGFQESRSVIEIIHEYLPDRIGPDFTCGANLNGAQLKGVNVSILNGDNGIYLGEPEYQLLFDWLSQVVEEYHLSYQTFYHARMLIDYFIQERIKLGAVDLLKVNRINLQTIGCACLFISSKLFESYPPSGEDFVYIADRVFNLDRLLQFELTIVKVLNFDLYFPTIAEYIGYALGPRRDYKLVRLVHIIATLISILPYPIRSRSVAFAAVYIVLRCASLENIDLPECLKTPDERGLGLELVRSNADKAIAAIRNMPRVSGPDNTPTNSGILTSRSDMQVILTNWDKCRAVQTDVLSPLFYQQELAVADSKTKQYLKQEVESTLHNDNNITIAEKQEILEEFTAGEMNLVDGSVLVPAKNNKNDIHVKLTVTLSDKVKWQYLSREMLGDFIKRLLLNRALAFSNANMVNAGKGQLKASKDLKSFVKYFKFVREVNGGYRIGDVNPERIHINMGNPEADDVQIMIIFKSVYNNTKTLFKTFSQQYLVTKENFVYRDLEGRFTSLRK